VKGPKARTGRRRYFHPLGFRRGSRRRIFACRIIRRGGVQKPRPAACNLRKTPPTEPYARVLSKRKKTFVVNRANFENKKNRSNDDNVESKFVVIISRAQLSGWRSGRARARAPRTYRSLIYIVASRVRARALLRLFRPRQ